jgi:hypothetical protein
MSDIDFPKQFLHCGGGPQLLLPRGKNHASMIFENLTSLEPDTQDPFNTGLEGVFI